MLGYTHAQSDVTLSSLSDPWVTWAVTTILINSQRFIGWIISAQFFTWNMLHLKLCQLPCRTLFSPPELKPKTSSQTTAYKPNCPTVFSKADRKQFGLLTLVNNVKSLQAANRQKCWTEQTPWLICSGTVSNSGAKNVKVCPEGGAKVKIMESLKAKEDILWKEGTWSGHLIFGNMEMEWSPVYMRTFGRSWDILF